MRNEIIEICLLKRLSLVTAVSILAFMGASCFSNQTNNPNQLIKGNPVTEKIMNDAVHTYTAELEKNLFVNLSVEQHDVDIITKVFAPNGELVGEFDTPTSGRGTEQIRFGTDAAGEYRIEIYTLNERAEPGEYKLEIADFRPVTERDQKVIAAVKLHQQADILRSKKETMRDSLPVYEKALAIWRELGEKFDEGNTLRAMGFANQRLGELDKAKEHFGKALAIWEQIGDVRSAAFTHVIFGVISKKQDDFETGLKEDLTAQTLWEKAGDLPEATQNLVRIGGDYAKLGNKYQSIAYYQKALESSRNVEKKSIKAYVMSSYADALADSGDKTEALNYYKQSLDIWKSLDQEKVVSDLQGKIDKLNIN